MKTKLLSITCLLSLFFSTSIFSQSDIFDNSFLHEIRINFEGNNFWQQLTDNYNIGQFEGDIAYLMGQVTIDGNVVDSIGVRQKGFSSHFTANQFKKSFKLDFNEFVDGQKYNGQKKINLNNGVGDPVFSRDAVCYNVFRHEGVAAARTSHAKLYINDELWGVYLIVEQIDDRFIDRNFADGNGNLFKNVGNTALEWLGDNPETYKQTIQLRTNEEEDDWTQFIRFLDIINNSSDAEFADSIQAIFDVDYYLKILAIDIITNNWDSYIEHGRNFYLYFEPSTAKFKWIPWDYNLALGGELDFGGGPGGPGTNPPDTIDPETCFTIINNLSPHPADDTIFQQVIAQDPFCCETDWDDTCQQQYNDLSNSVGGGTGNPILGQNFNLILNNPEKVLIERILNVPDFRERYLNYACNILEHNFTAERLHPMISANGELIRETIYEETNYLFTTDEFENDLNDTQMFGGDIPLKIYIDTRIAQVKEQLEDLNHDCQLVVAPIEWNDLVINEFVASNDSLGGTANLNGEYSDWIELYNNTDDVIDLSGFYLSDNFDIPKKWAFPQGAVIAPNDYLIIWADDQESTINELHVNFKLSKSGEQLLLIHEDNSIIDSLQFGEQESNIASARLPNGTGNFTQQATTFNANNENVSSTIEQDIPRFKLFPNPATTSATIQLGEGLQSKDGQLTIFNALGQIMYAQTLNKSTSEQSFSTNFLVPGIYFVQIRIDGKKATKKLTISK